MEEDDKENCPLVEDLSEKMNSFHEKLMVHCSLKALQASEDEEVETNKIAKKNHFLSVFVYNSPTVFFPQFSVQNSSLIIFVHNNYLVFRKLSAPYKKTLITKEYIIK